MPDSLRTITVPFTKLRRIIHLADIHIRLFKRHQEYIACFERLYSDLLATDLTDTVIVVAGDLVHAKTDLSPEMVSVASEFLNRLASLAPTILIAGNHDLNLANPNRLDSLTPIVNNLKNTNLHYLKYSEIVSCADVDFYVCSIVEDQVYWPKALPNTRTKIALFHGPVHDAKTDVGYTITNRHIMIETFDGYDMVIMGDIHRHQVLQQYDPSNSKPIIVYSSSLIQQNHGETLRGHGWCDWDVANRSFQFKELPNEHGYYTLEIENGLIPDWSDMPQNVTLRIFAGSLDQTEIKKLVAQIRAKRNVVELSVSNFEGARKVSTSHKIGSAVDVFDVNVQNGLILEYLKEAMPNLSADVLDLVVDLNKKNNNEISKDDLARKVLWRPKSLKFSNLFTYGDDNFIDFTTLDGVVGIFAPNASGKTSIAEAICFALYDQTPRTKMAANIMNTRSTKCSCEFRFEIDGVEYVVNREGTKDKKGKVKIDVDFYRLENGNKVSLNGEERRYTNANIRQYVGDFEDFLLTTFSSSSQKGLFVDRDQADRKDLLTQFMGLNIFDKLQSLAESEIRDVQSALKRFKKEDFTQALVDVHNEMLRLDVAKGVRDMELEAVNAELNRITDATQKLYEQKIPVGLLRNPAELDRLEERLKREEADMLAGIQQTTEARTSLKEKLEVAKTKMQEFDNIDEEYQSYLALQSQVSRFEANYKHADNKLVLCERELENLSKHKYDPACTFCLKNGATTIARINEIQATLPKLRVEAQDLYETWQTVAEQVKEKATVSQKYQNFIAAQRWISNADGRLIVLDQSNIAHNGQLLGITEKMNQLATERTKYVEAQATIERNKELDIQISELEIAKKQEKANFNVLSSAIQKIVAETAVWGQKKKDMLAKIQEAEELEIKYEVYEAYLAAVCRDGLPYRLISKVLPALEVSVNDLLSQMVSFTLLFETDGKNVNMKIRYDDDRVWPLELASGMEKFISSLAIRVALTTVSSLPKSNFLIIDEGLGTLDQDNLASIFMLFNVLRTQFDFILLISHVEEVRDVADTLLEIKRDHGFSQITT